MRHHHHGSADEIVVFHDEVGEPDYLFKNWQQPEDPCNCGMVDPFDVTNPVTFPSRIRDGESENVNG